MPEVNIDEQRPHFTALHQQYIVKARRKARGIFNCRLPIEEEQNPATRRY
jgi:hypothetical protein